MNICIYGGTFSPPHKAHKIIVETLLQKSYMVIIVPCGTRPDKPSANIIPLYHRKEMIKIAFGDIKGIYIDFYDFINSTYTPTYLLQERYEKLYCLSHNKNDAKIWHLIGEDIITGGRNKTSEIHRVWDYGEKIWNELNFLVVVRPGYNAHPEDMPPHSRILEIGDIIGSGTLVRKRIADNRLIIDLVEPEIDEYIKDNKLYMTI